MSSFKFFNFLKRNWHWLLFIILGFSSLSFLLFQKGLWTYLDNSFFISYFNVDLHRNLFSNLQLFQNSQILWGTDNSILGSFKIVHSFLLKLPFALLPAKPAQVFFFIVYLFLVFLVSLAFFKAVSIKHYKLISLFYTFNPLTVYLLSQSGFALAYVALPLVLFSIIKYFRGETIRWKYLLLLIIGVNLLLSYPRLTILYTSLIIILSSHFLYIFIKNHVPCLGKKIILAGTTLLLSHLFILSNTIAAIYDHQYTNGALEYTTAFSQSYGPTFYRNNAQTPFFEAYLIKEPTHNFANWWHDDYTFLFISFLLTISVVSGLTVIKKTNGMYLLSLVLYMLTIAINLAAHFLTEKTFIKFTYTWFPALTNNTSWILFIQIFALSIIIGHLLESSKKTRVHFFYIIIFLYIGASIFPLTQFRSNASLKKIDPAHIPNQLYKFILDPNQKKEGAAYLPQKELIFDWSNYPINLGYYSNFIQPFSDNQRLVAQKQARLAQQVENDGQSQNNFLFNIKNIFLFNKIKNNTNNFPFYTTNNVQLQSDSYKRILEKQKRIKIYSNGDYLTWFKINDAPNYDFSIYNPLEVIESEIENFHSLNIQPQKRPIVLDQSSFNRPLGVYKKNLSQDIKISVKSSPGNPTKYYLKLENVDITLPFIIQMNQTFVPSWKVRWVSKKYFEKKECVDDWKYFHITNNQTCSYRSSLLPIGDIDLLTRSYVPEKNHFEGNFIGNAWLINPADIPSEYQNDDELYLVIYFEKQIYYIITLTISGLTLLTLIVLTIMQETKEYRSKRYAKIKAKTT